MPRPHERSRSSIAGADVFDPAVDRSSRAKLRIAGVTSEASANNLYDGVGCLIWRVTAAAVIVERYGLNSRS